MVYLLYDLILYARRLSWSRITCCEVCVMARYDAVFENVSVFMLKISVTSCKDAKSFGYMPYLLVKPVRRSRC